MKLYLSEYRENPKNNSYPRCVDVTKLEELAEAVKYDHMICKMAGGLRKTGNFMECDGLMVDVDNTHSENPDAWVTDGDIYDAFPFTFYLVNSRNYMKPKRKVSSDGKVTFFAPRQKWHVYIPLREPVTDPAEYERLILNLLCLFPYIDVAAIDNARFFFGVQNPVVQSVGDCVLFDEYLKDTSPDQLRAEQLRAVTDYTRNVKEGYYKNDKSSQTAINKASAFLGIASPFASSAPASTPTPGQTSLPAGDDIPEWVRQAEQAKAEQWLIEWAKGHDVELGKRYVYDNPGRPHTVAYCVACPWEHEHSEKGAENEAVIMIDLSGKFSFLCRHTHGAALNWNQYRAFYEDKRREELAAAWEAQKAGQYDVHNLVLDDASTSQDAPQAPTSPAASEPVQTATEDAGSAQSAAEGAVLPEGRPADYRAYYRECFQRMDAPEVADYLSSRGITITTAKHFLMGYDPAADPIAAPGLIGKGYRKHPRPRLIIPTTRTHYTARRIDGETLYRDVAPRDSKPGLLNATVLADAENVFIVGGAFDLFTLYECGAAAVSVPTADALLKHVEANRPAGTLILSFPTDRAGKTLTGKIRQGLQRLNISYITADLTRGLPSINDAWVKDPGAVRAAVEDAIMRTAARPDNVADYIDKFMGDDIADFGKPKKTGFAKLDSECGGLYPGLYTIGAISSLGKTTFTHQIADQLAEQGHDVLFFSMEQSRLEMVSKSISRITAQMDFSSYVDSLSIRRGFLPPNVQAAAKEYKRRVGDRMSVIEGNFNCDIGFISDYVQYYKQKNGVNPVVFIDYLQIIRPTEEGKTAKDTVDNAVVELKRLSRDAGITIFVISSLNRANYLTPVDYESFKESGAIEYTSDVLWGLQLACLEEDLFSSPNKIKEKRERVQQAKNEIPRKIELVSLKNRYGKPTFKCLFDYFGGAELFRETVFRYDINNLTLPEHSGSRRG